MTGSNGEEASSRLCETKEAKGRSLYKLFSLTILTGIVLIWIYRLIHIPETGKNGRWAWIIIFFCEILFGLYWILTQPCRWKMVYRTTLKNKLVQRFKDDLPRVDIFVCTADHMKEPTSMVINTVLSLMSYNYPPEKLTIYVSDDGGSEITFYSLLEAAEFSKHWIHFCNKNCVDPRSPEVYFAKNISSNESNFKQEWTRMKKLYTDMKNRIDSVVKNSSIPKEIKERHKGFSEWNLKVTKQDHHSIVQILLDGWNPTTVDAHGNRLPSLIYLSREKKTGWFHNFKAGSMNSLIRVSEEISNAPIILNVDCDMYSNDPDSILDALCFFLDEKMGNSIGYVQFPQRFSNTTKNDIYANSLNIIFQIEMAGLDGYDGVLYVGTGCFHRREALSGKKYSDGYKSEWRDFPCNIKGRTITELEEASKVLADCNYEKDTLWGKEVGLVYGFPVEDVVTGLAILCRGWKSLYYNPSKSGFLGLSPITLGTALLQHKRWGEGLFQIFISKYCPFIHGRGKLALGAQMGYVVYQLWAPSSLPTLVYVIIPSLCLIHDVPLFPQVSSLWIAPFVYVFVSSLLYNLLEVLFCGDTLKCWWNLQRMWVIRRTSSYFLAFVTTVSKELGFSETPFLVTDKAIDEEVEKRYEQEIMEFGSSSNMFIIISTLSLLNLFSLSYGIKKIVFDNGGFDMFACQIVLCGILTMLNLPVLEALLLRNDEGSLPSSVLFISILAASVSCLIPVY